MVVGTIDQAASKAQPEEGIVLEPAFRRADGQEWILEQTRGSVYQGHTFPRRMNGHSLPPEGMQEHRPLPRPNINKKHTLGEWLKSSWIVPAAARF